jgi:excinuclease ABC subunit C
MAQIKTANIQDLKDIANNLPKKPGCYLFKNKFDEVIYVGKAKSLFSRVKSYFYNDHKDSPKTKVLVDKICDIEFQLAESEAEALILENNLIKKYLPKYNIRLRDDKSYPYVIIKKDSDFPRLEFRRRAKKDKGNYSFGPFVHGSNISSILRELNRSFALRDCSDYEFKSRKDPCLLYQMKQCSAPCVGLISESDYKVDLGLALSVLKGKGSQAISFLTKKMIHASDNELFEQAATIRDSIEVLNDFIEKHSLSVNIESSLPESMDIISIYNDGVESDISITVIRKGVILGQKSFYFFSEDFGLEYEDGFLNFCFQYYGNSLEDFPARLLLDISDENYKLITVAFNKYFDQKIRIIKSQPKWNKLLDLNKEQAYQSQRLRKLNKDHHFNALLKLKELLHFKEVPKHLECYDVAVWQGRSPTASQVVFRDGVADKQSYRHYHLKELPEGNNDYAMMKEVIDRRLKKGNYPDLLIVDGGKGQVGIVTRLLEERKVKIPVVGIAKSKTKSSFRKSKINATSERLIIPGRKNGYELSQSMSLFRLITSMRDEAHRFSRRLHHSKEKKHHFSSFLDDIDGIGPKTKENILNRLDKPWSEYASMSVEELSKNFQIDQKKASGLSDKLSKTFLK